MRLSKIETCYGLSFPRQRWRGKQGMNKAERLVTTKDTRKRQHNQIKIEICISLISSINYL